MAWSYEAFEDWFLGFAYSTEGTSLVHRAAGRLGLAPAIADDLRQEWVLAVRRTVAGRARGSDRLIEFVDADTSASYVTRALQNKAIDLLRKDRSTPEPIDPGRPSMAANWSDATPHELRAVSPSAEALVTERDWCETARQQITNDLHGNVLRCPGCPAPRVAQIALYAINVWCDRPTHESLPSWTAEIQGGTQELDQLIYQALLQIFPEQVQRSADGRLAANVRKMKQRCGDCVRDLLRDIARRCHTLTTGDVVSDVDGLDHG